MDREFNLQCVTDTVKEIIMFDNKHGRKSTEDAIWYGAWNHFPGRTINMMVFIHPTDEVRKIVPSWIIDLYCGLVE